jgi:subtilisin family serine protease
MGPLDVVRLPPLMDRTRGRPEIRIGLIDGPVLLRHPDLANQNIHEVPSRLPGTCASGGSAACLHGTSVAGMLLARRGSLAPAICPDCTLLVRPIFSEGSRANGDTPSAVPQELAEAVMDCVNAGARVINLSLNVLAPSSRDERHLEAVLSYVAARGVIVVVAAGNQGEVGGSSLSRHPWPIPVSGSDGQGRPTATSNLGRSIGRYGLRAPSENIASLGPDSQIRAFSGTSAAAPFVSGAIALLWSEFPGASATAVKLAVNRADRSARRGVVPPLLDAWAAYQTMSAVSGGRKAS